MGLVVVIGSVAPADAARRHHRHPTRTAAARDAGDDVASSPKYAAYVVDDKSGRVLYAKNADAPRHPASLTKMMTLYLLFEDLEKHRVSLNSRFTVSAHAADQAPSKLGIRPGQTIAVEDAIRALVTKSANDVAVTIAENLGGSESAFAQRMTRTARRLGMPGSTFYNASGLPNAAQYTTARDMVTLGRALQERFPAYYRYFSTRSFAWGNQVIPNHNKLLYRVEGVDGIKTGYTEASGFNLVSSIRRDDRHLVAAVLGGTSGRARDDHMARLLATQLPKASTGGKVSSVFREIGGRQADASDDDDDGLKTASIPTPEPTPAPAQQLLALAPIEAAVATPAPAAPAATTTAAGRVPGANQPRIGASDVTPLPIPESTRRTSSDQGAAVAMARAILLPDSGRSYAGETASVRPQTPPTQVAAVATTDDPRRPRSLAEATISASDLAAYAPAPAPVPQKRVETPPVVKVATVSVAAPTPVVTRTETRTGWMIQIGAYDREEAARGALGKAKSQAAAALARAEPFTESVGGSGRLWRARFAGFNDQSAAENACKALKRKDFACLALRQ